jgi:hypothetical protein
MPYFRCRKDGFTAMVTDFTSLREPERKAVEQSKYEAVRVKQAPFPTRQRLAGIKLTAAKQTEAARRAGLRILHLKVLSFR